MVVRDLIIKEIALKELQEEILYHRSNTSEAFASTMKTHFMDKVDSILPLPAYQNSDVPKYNLG